MSGFRLHVGDALEQLRLLPAASMQCCVTSPPYWGLRDYGVEGQIGLEATPAEFIARLVEVFREVRRVLRPEGTAWVNLGDTYASAGWGGGVGDSTTLNGKTQHAARAARERLKSRVAGGVKPKDKLGIPWRVAFALQDDGWWLRSDIVWHKSNPMPESVRDRPTVAHEFVFLLSKSERYFYNTEAARERCIVGSSYPRKSKATLDAAAAARAFSRKRKAGVEARQGEYSAEEAAERLARGKGAASARMGRGPGWRVKQNESFAESVANVVEFRNWRDVWAIPTQPSAFEHFAAFPEELARRCIVAGSAPGDVVLDPFAGTCTTGVVALEEGRQFVGIELNPAYAQMGERRSRTVTPHLPFAGGVR